MTATVDLVVVVAVDLRRLRGRGGSGDNIGGGASPCDGNEKARPSLLRWATRSRRRRQNALPATDQFSLHVPTVETSFPPPLAADRRRWQLSAARDGNSTCMCANIKEIRSKQHELENVFQDERKTVMILPQVHLRKPCYDFYFL